MSYTPPAHPSPAASALHSPFPSRPELYLYQPSPTLRYLACSCSRPESPRSTSYLHRHLRILSVQSAVFVPSHQTTPLSTVDDEKDDTGSLTANDSLQQAPSLIDELKVPVGVVISPPDSGQNSSDDEGTKGSGGRMENLADFQAAVGILEHRGSPPTETTADFQKTVQALHLVMPSKDETAHDRSNTDSSVLSLHSDLAAETPLTGSEEDYSDDHKPGLSWRKTPILRKKSGELVRPALRPSSARRRPSSMPSTPTFSKAVHFDSHLEHVRHFLQFDEPLVVNAGSSPIKAYGSDTKLPFGKEDESNGGSPPYKWELVVSSFPAETPERLLLLVRVERIFLSSDNKVLIGRVAVANLAYNKIVITRFTVDYWKTTSEVVAEYNDDYQQKNADGYDRFDFNIKLADQGNLEAKTMFFYVKYVVNGQEYWDSNNSANFQIDFKKKYRPQNRKKGIQGIGSWPTHYSLPWNHKSSSATSCKPRTELPAFNDYVDSLDTETNLLLLRNL